ncbi:MAG: EamA family transporter [Spirochaetales bacterium]|nr:EamA family transporter [Spirochaetales bacterium]
MASQEEKHHTFAVLQALLVTFLWSTSFVIIKKMLIEIPPLTFAGLRYLMASVCLLPFLSGRKYRVELGSINRATWLNLLLLGLTFYVITQGAQFVGLSLLPSATVSLMLNFTPLVVVALGAVVLKERPSLRQIGGILLFLGGTGIFFFPSASVSAQGKGIAVMALGVLANAFSSVLGRRLNSRKTLSPLTITVVSMGIGSVILTSAGIIRDGFPRLSPSSWLALIWLAAVNTAFAFTLWNRTLRTLTAMESSVINGTMLIQIAVLAWFFLGEELTAFKIAGMVVASAGAVLVQLKKRR